MNITITARHFNASNRLHEFATKNVTKLEKFYDGILDCDIVFEPNESPVEPQKVELRVKVAKTFLTASETAETYEQAIGKAIENIKRQLIKYKDKQFQKIS